jgi:hypothetical protein
VVDGFWVDAHADSAGAGSAYGAVLENHEVACGPYDNVGGPVLSQAAAGRHRWQ